jgi:NAD(P)-dependent dehydrogenase (short-subunit alcohol dehydrogenase family)
VAESPSDSPRAVLTTGSNSGIGLATVVELARRGYRSIGSVRSDAKAEVVHAAADEAGVDIETVRLDVTDEDRCIEVLGELAPLYGVVNNAGIGGAGAIEDVSDDEARQMFETMLLAPMRLARLALPGMREAGRGRIINVSSIYGRFTTPLTGWYQAAKHGLEAASDALRMEVASDGIDVVLVEPGGFKTGIWDDLDRDVEQRSDSRYADAYERAQTLQRLAARFMGEPERVARVIGDALDARRSRARYLVGIDARAAVTVDSLTITALKDLVRRRVLGL